MNEANRQETPEADCLESRGPWPFITRRLFRRSGGRLAVWRSRHHRKGVLARERSLTLADAETLLEEVAGSRRLSIAIGFVFAIGSLCFIVGSLLSLFPAWAVAVGVSAPGVNSIFFAGSIPFTVAGYLQLYQAANAPQVASDGRLEAPARVRLFGWLPSEIGWLSSALQFAGTVLFNFNTFDAIWPAALWQQQALSIWLPDFAGSVLFLASGYLAWVETCHAHGAWRPRSLSWWVTTINLLGCVGFMISACFAIVLPGPPIAWAVTIATWFTLQGAVCFFAGAVLMLPEALWGSVEE